MIISCFTRPEAMTPLGNILKQDTKSTPKKLFPRSTKAKFNDMTSKVFLLLAFSSSFRKQKKAHFPFRQFRYFSQNENGKQQRTT
jgi:hypothetical protein